MTNTLLKPARLFHLYSGVFIAPALLFFAFTGAIQTFSLHETTRGSSYKPPAILVMLGQLHKKQTIVVPGPKRAPAAEAKPAEPKSTAPTAPPAPAPPAGRQHNLLPMKIFFLTVAIGLFFSTLTGIYMAYKYARRKSVISAVLLAGIVVPLLLLLF